MGYDMRWCRVDDSEKDEVAALRIAFYEAVGVRDALPREEGGQFSRAVADALGDWDAHDAYDGRTDRYREAQDKVNAACVAVELAERSYFRLNIFSMGRYRELMLHLGMAFEDGPHPDWPEHTDYGITDEQVWAADNPEDDPEAYATITPEVMAQVLAFQAELTSVLAFHGKADTPGIPLHKFGSNDGWIVLPVECEAAVRIWRGADDNLVRARLGDQFDYWLRWIDFLDGAANHDGFEVH